MTSTDRGPLVRIPPGHQPLVRRGRSPEKRAAILGAAETLFVADGYQGASVDAIAARAGVSKRTVYDHFGGKDRLFSAVMAAVSASVVSAVDEAVQQELPDGCDPAPALLAFVRRLASVTFASSHYVLFRKLLAVAGPMHATVIEERNDPAELLSARISAFGATGELSVPNPRRATDHFVALTLLVAVDALDRRRDASVIDEILVDGVDAFLRAYESRPASLRPDHGSQKVIAHSPGPTT